MDMPAVEREPFVEMRGQAPRPLVDVLDAISAARRMTRWDLVLHILGEWGDQAQREAVSLLRVAGTDMIEGQKK